ASDVYKRQWLVGVVFWSRRGHCGQFQTSFFAGYGTERLDRGGASGDNAGMIINCFKGNPAAVSPCSD
ncbi:MAG: hypothetical protein EBZ11_06525, partial [Alphaproteobacteria bacterium]|nr:hypothetical protein [Alphaproteobacteria bacterium]